MQLLMPNMGMAEPLGLLRRNLENNQSTFFFAPLLLRLFKIFVLHSYTHDPFEAVQKTSYHNLKPDTTAACNQLDLLQLQ